MKKYFITGLLVCLLAMCGNMARAQYGPPTIGIHITAPWAVPYKVGLKLEYRIYPENALLLSYTYNYAYYPGYQAYLEYRLYFNTLTATENIIYMKLGNGFADYRSSPIFSDNNSSDKAPGTYYFGGAGVGKHFNIHSFFMEITAGLKFSYVTKPPASYDERTFYTIGPGAIPDVNFHFGFQF